MPAIFLLRQFTGAFVVVMDLHFFGPHRVVPYNVMKFDFPQER
jgi:hypothetical protein